MDKALVDEGCLQDIFLLPVAGPPGARRPRLADLETATEQALRFDPATPDTLTVDSVKTAFQRIPDPFRAAILLVDCPRRLSTRRFLRDAP